MSDSQPRAWGWSKDQRTLRRALCTAVTSRLHSRTSPVKLSTLETVLAGVEVQGVVKTGADGSPAGPRSVLDAANEVWGSLSAVLKLKPGLFTVANGTVGLTSPAPSGSGTPAATGTGTPPESPTTSADAHPGGTDDGGDGDFEHPGGSSPPSSSSDDDNDSGFDLVGLYQDSGMMATAAASMLFRWACPNCTNVNRIPPTEPMLVFAAAVAKRQTAHRMVASFRRQLDARINAELEAFAQDLTTKIQEGTMTLDVARQDADARSSELALGAEAELRAFKETTLAEEEELPPMPDVKPSPGLMCEECGAPAGLTFGVLSATLGNSRAASLVSAFPGGKAAIDDIVFKGGSGVVVQPPPPPPPPSAGAANDRREPREGHRAGGHRRRSRSRSPRRRSRSRSPRRRHRSRSRSPRRHHDSDRHRSDDRRHHNDDRYRHGDDRHRGDDRRHHSDNRHRHSDASRRDRDRDRDRDHRRERGEEAGAAAGAPVNIAVPPSPAPAAAAAAPGPLSPLTPFGATPVAALQVGSPAATRALFGEVAGGRGSGAPVVALGYDHHMLLHEEIKPPPEPLLPTLPAPVQPPHPERPNRLASIASHLVATGVFQRCARVPSREVTDQELALVHTSDHLETVFANCEVPEGEGHHFGSDTYANSHSAKAARLACGTLIEVTRRVVCGDAHRGVALIRPPGHHAEPDRAMGFCLFNNVGVVAQLARQEWGAQRVLIVDWDVHHGNGTQDMFEDDPTILYFSAHRFDGGSFYPGTGRVTEVGSGSGVGYTVNVPWPHGGMGDAEYLSAWESVLMPISRQFSPELVIISAGFDAAAGDPLGGCNITPAGYAHLTSLLLTLAGGRCVVALEGGYNLRSISNSMESVVRMLLGESPPPLGDASTVPWGVATPGVAPTPLGAPPTPGLAAPTPAVVGGPLDAPRMMNVQPALDAPSRGGANAIASAIMIHSRYWSCMRRALHAQRRLLEEYRVQREVHADALGAEVHPAEHHTHAHPLEEVAGLHDSPEGDFGRGSGSVGEGEDGEGGSDDVEAPPLPPSPPVPAEVPVPAANGVVAAAAEGGEEDGEEEGDAPSGAKRVRVE